MSPNSPDEALIAAAEEARAFAYAPYSRFQVGAAVRFGDTVVTGVNVENGSYGLTVCAERHAIAAAVRVGAKPGQVTAVAVVAEADQATPPCGACRQVLMEFAAPEAAVWLKNVRDGKVYHHGLHDLLPHAFSRSGSA